MHKKDRLDDILAILKKQGYVTVKYLTERLHYSTATINRDLNFLQNQRMVKRSYGGVELTGNTDASMVFRYHKMRTVKSQLAKKAAEFIKNGDVIFIDGTTTTQHIAPYITDRKDLTVITNNVALVPYLSKYGITVVCLGGQVQEVPYILSGVETIENAARYRADKVFFSAGALLLDGGISSGYALLLQTMLRNSKHRYLLMDHKKIVSTSRVAHLNLSQVDTVISDYDFDDTIREAFPETEFICVK